MTSTLSSACARSLTRNARATPSRCTWSAKVPAGARCSATSISPCAKTRPSTSPIRIRPTRPCSTSALSEQFKRYAMMYEGMLAETVAFRGHNGDLGEAYYARPLGGGPWPGVVLIHHLPGWDEWIKEATRKLAYHGFATISPHLYFREGPGSPDDVGARVRAAGGVADAQVVGDVAGGMEFLRAQPYANGKVGLIGFCSGGRHGYLPPGSLSNVDAAVDCRGGDAMA